MVMYICTYGKLVPTWQLISVWDLYCAIYQPKNTLPDFTYLIFTLISRAPQRPMARAMVGSHI